MAQHYTEERLLYDIKNGSRDAMKRLYNLYSGYAMAIAMRYVPDKDDAADILQDSFVKIFTKIADVEYRGEGTLRSWMARVVANEALGFLRRRGGITFTDNFPDDADGDDEPDIDALTDDDLRAMIASLPDGYRVIVNMYVFGQMSHKQIAEELGISASTSASQFFHAKRLLARMIKQRCGGKPATISDKKT